MSCDLGEGLPAEFNCFLIYQGATFSYKLTWGSDADESEPMNLTGYTAKMKVKVGTHTVVELTTENGGITLGGVLGTIQLYISAEDTADLVPANGRYDLLLTSNAGVVTALLVGQMPIIEGVSAE